MLTFSFAVNAQEIELFEYEVQSKENLKTIAKKFKLTMSDLKMTNPGVGRRVKPKTILYVPIYGNENFVYHQVRPKETLYSIAAKYGVTVDLIKEANKVKLPLSIGVLLKFDRATVPSEDELLVTRSLLEEEFILHEVVKGDTYYNLEQRYEVVKDSLEIRNKDINLAEVGLQLGMVLKIKSRLAESAVSEEEVVVFEDNLKSDKKVFNIAFMLPLKLNRNDTLSPVQTFRKKGAVLDRVSDYYLGALMAIDSLRNLGYQIEKRVYDTENSATKVREIVLLENFAEVDLLVGPFYSDKVDLVASRLRNTPVVFPMYSKKQSSFSRSNYIIPNPEKRDFAAALNSYIIKNYCDENVIIVQDDTAESIKQTQDLLASLKAVNDSIQPKIIKSKNDNVSFEVLSKKMDSLATNNWVVMTNKGTTGYSLIDGIVALDPSIRARLFVNDNNSDFEVSKHKSLEDIDFTFASAGNLKTQSDGVRKFFFDYRERYMSFPSEYSILGFDQVFDLLIRYFSEGGFEEESFQGVSTRISNTFNYAEDENGVLRNGAIDVIRYREN
jgi:LysM repeat protein